MRAWTLSLAVLLACAPAAIAEVSVTVDSDTVVVGEPFYLMVTGSGGEVEDVEMPNIPGLHVESNASINRIEWKLINFQRSTIKIRGYQAQALKAGKIEVPAIGVEVDGKMEYSDPIALTAVDGGQGSRRAMGNEYRDERESRELLWERILFIRAETNRTSVFVGEPVQLRLSLWQMANQGISFLRAMNGMDTQWPDTQGFYVLPQEPEKVGGSRKTEEGYDYQVQTWRQILYPTHPGALTIGSWSGSGTAAVRTIMGNQIRDYQLKTEPLEIEVKALPRPPAGFSGAVGTYEIEGYLSRDQVFQGLPVQLVVAVRGQGNPDAINAPPAPKVEGAYVGDPIRDTKQISDPDGLSFQRTFTYDITPGVVGSLKIPVIEFIHFDPNTEQFVTKSLGPFSVSVMQAPEHANAIVEYGNEAGNDIDILAPGLRPIVMQATRLHRASTAWIATAPIVFAAPALGYLVFVQLLNRRRRFSTDSAFARNYRARNRARKRLEEVSQATEPYEPIFRALTGYIADKFNANAAGLTSADAEQMFKERGIEADLTDKVVKILRTCERARYASAVVSEPEIEALVQGTLAAIERIETMLKRGTAT